MRDYKIIVGDLVRADTDFIVHQVNCKGAMNSGVAKAIRNKYPKVYDEYRKSYEKHINYSGETSHMLGIAQFVPIYDSNNPKKPFYCINMFSQNDYGYNGGQYTSIAAMLVALKEINEKCAGYTVAFPWKVGCVRGGADWDEVLPLICETLTDVKEIVFYKLEE